MINFFLSIFNEDRLKTVNFKIKCKNLENYKLK